MFDTYGGNRKPAGGRYRWLTASASALAHVAILGALVIAPLTAVTTPPAPSAIQAFIAPAPMPAPPPPPPPPPAPTSPGARQAPTPSSDAPRFVAPIETPPAIVPETAVDTAVDPGVLGGVEGGVAGGVLGGTLGGLPSAVPPPPPPPPPPVPVRIGGAIKAPALITRVAPEYPPIARAAQLEGDVILEASVADTGRVESVKVLRSAGLLDDAAVDAVKRWRYSPLRLNGVPTPFVLTVTLRFELGDGHEAGGATDGRDR